MDNGCETYGHSPKGIPERNPVPVPRFIQHAGYRGRQAPIRNLLTCQNPQRQPRRGPKVARSVARSVAHENAISHK